MRKTYFIINPESGKKQGRKLSVKIEKLWKHAGIPCEICMTLAPSDVAASVHKALTGGATELIVAGGDGTLLEVVSALKGTTLPIGVIPCGTGNDFIRSQRISMNIDQALMTALRAEHVTNVDIGNCNDAYFLNVASIGIDAAIVKRTAKMKKWISGPLVYLLASIIEIFKDRPRRVTITIDGIDYERTVEMVVIANGRFYGGGMEIAPMADPEDGYYDILVIRKMPRLKLLSLLPALYAGQHIRQPAVEVFKGRRVHIRSEEMMTINRDGELSADHFLTVDEIQETIQIITNI